MTQAMTGPWSLSTRKLANHIRERFTISGSDNADGVYEVRANTPFTLQVDGARWHVEIHILLSNGWVDGGGVNRGTRFTLGRGLVVRLASASCKPQPSTGDLFTLVVTGVSQDPVINPPQIPNPYDFSLGRSDEKRYPPGD